MDNSWIATYTGKKFHFLSPQPEEIDIRDIAHALSLKCRFGGHCRVFYSVAEHSLRVARLLAPTHQLAALMHDAAEAYLPDVPRPTKSYLPVLQEMEMTIQSAIVNKFFIKIDKDLVDLIKAADDVILAAEARDLMADSVDWSNLKLDEANKMIGTVHPNSSQAAEWAFLLKFKELGGIA